MKYQKYWLTPTQAAKTRLLIDEGEEATTSLHFRALQELEAVESRHLDECPTWWEYCTSNAEFEVIVEVAYRLLQANDKLHIDYSTFEKFRASMGNLPEVTQELQQEFGLTRHDLLFVHDAMVTRPGRLMPNIEQPE